MASKANNAQSRIFECEKTIQDLEQSRTEDAITIGNLKKQIENLESLARPLTQATISQEKATRISEFEQTHAQIRFTGIDFDRFENQERPSSQALISEIASHLGQSPQTLSQHIKEVRQMGKPSVHTLSLIHI